MSFREFLDKHKEASQQQIDSMLSKYNFVRTLPLDAQTVELWAKTKQKNGDVTRAHYDLQVLQIETRALSLDLTKLSAWAAGFQSTEAMNAAGYMVFINPETGEASVYHNGQANDDKNLVKKNREHG